MPSQAVHDRVGRAAMRLYGDQVETITYHHIPARGGPHTDHTVHAVFGRYRLSAVLPEPLQPTDHECRIQTAVVTWGAPTTEDHITRADGSVWKVLSVAGGPGTPFYRLPVRDVGGFS